MGRRQEEEEEEEKKEEASLIDNRQKDINHCNKIS